MNELVVSHYMNQESETHSFLVNQTEVARMSLAADADHEVREWILGAILPAKFPDARLSADNEDEAVDEALGWLKDFFETRPDQVPGLDRIEI